MKSFLTAVSLLSILPVPRRWTGNLKTCSTYFPLVGFLLGVIYYAIALGMSSFGISGDWTGFMVLFAMVIFTRAFHLDGLADMADGFWGGSTKERTLAIMKDPAAGTFGVMALILIILIKWIALNHIAKDNSIWMIIPAAMISRFVMTLMAGLFSYARSEGTGHTVISYTSLKNVVAAAAYAVPLMVLFFGFASLILIVIGISVSFLTGLLSRKKISGITGDVLGAASEITEGLLLAIMPFLRIHFFPDFWNSYVF